jgi:hypothetical protein
VCFSKESRKRLTPVVRREMAWLTRLNGETSTACRRTVPWEPIRVESSRGPVLTIASTANQRDPPYDHLLTYQGPERGSAR